MNFAWSWTGIEPWLDGEKFGVIFLTTVMQSASTFDGREFPREVGSLELVKYGYVGCRCERHTDRETDTQSESKPEESDDSHTSTTFGEFRCQVEQLQTLETTETHQRVICSDHVMRRILRNLHTIRNAWNNFREQSLSEKEEIQRNAIPYAS